MNRAISYWGMHALLRHEELVEEASRERLARTAARQRRSTPILGRVLRLRRNRP